MRQRIELFPTQRAFIESSASLAAFIGGIGSGKTFTGAVWLLRLALTAGEPLNFYACSNTYPQLKDALYPKFFGFLGQWGLREGLHYTFNKTDKDLKFFNGSVIMFRSLQNFNMLRGAEAAAALIDEARDAPEEAVNVIIGRLRQKENAQLKITTTPAGFNWIYDWYMDGRLDVYRMPTEENTKLPKSYIEHLKNQYSGDFLRQELFADFVNFGGKLVYNEFSRRKNIFVYKGDLGDDEPVYVGLDFNVDPFCAVAAFERDGVFYFFDEIVLRGLTIADMTREIHRRYGKRGKRPIYIYPDASARNRNVAKMTTILYDLQRSFGTDRVRYFSSNPRVVNRIQTTNNYLRDKKIMIDERLEVLIRDLERVKYKETGAMEIDKSDAQLTHASDALGYLIYYESVKNKNVWRQE